MTTTDKTKIIERYFGGWSVQQLIKDYQAHHTVSKQEAQEAVYEVLKSIKWNKEQDKPVTCAECKYGRDLGGKDYGCRNKEIYSIFERKVHKGEYTCGHGQKV